MATRSTIAIEFADGTIGQVYCHWDGYLSNNGKILLNNYMDPFKVRELIDNGSISSLGTEIGVKHPFDNPASFDTPAYQAYKDQYGHMTKFYGRDRGETDVGANYFTDYEHFLVDGQQEEFDYILRQVDGVATWFVSDHNGDFQPLLEAYIEVLREQNDEEAEQELLAKFVDLVKV